MAQPKALTGNTFLSLGLYTDTLDVLKAKGFERTTPVQQATIPLLTGNKDVCVEAQTGSGKTLAFVVPIVEILRRMEEPLKRYQVGAVIVSPTRELAQQIFAVAAPFVATLKDTSAQLLVGGSDPSADVARIKDSGAHVMIGTPGRLDDIMKRCSFLDTKALEIFVLDEADRLLDMGFKRQLDAIMARLPKQRRTGLFSATQTDAVEELARAGLRNPVRITVRQGAAGAGAGGAAARPGDVPDETKIPSTLRIMYSVVEPADKPAQLVRFIQQNPGAKVIIYFLTCACVEFYSTVLPELLGPKGAKAMPVRALHGRLKQAKREAALADFTKLPAGCLLCTDVAARGLDIPDVDWVLQYDPPQDPSAFVHRVGRTARMGRSGSALVLLSPSEDSYVEFIRLRKVPLEEAAPFEEGGGPGGAGGAGGAGGEDVVAGLRKLSESDRDVMEKGTRAFVSYIRGYKEHHCQYIFRHKLLEVGQMARAFGLLRMPGMAEVRKAPDALKAGFTESTVDPNSIKFKDKAREKQRLKDAERRAAEDQAAKDQRKKEKQDAYNEKKKLKQTAAKGVDDARRENAFQRRKREKQEEEDELNEEYRLYRMMKKGKMTQKQFDVATGVSDGEEDEGPAEAAAEGGGEGTRMVFGVPVPGGGGGGGGGAAAAVFGAKGKKASKAKPGQVKTLLQIKGGGMGKLGGPVKTGKGFAGNAEGTSDKSGKVTRRALKAKVKVKKNHVGRGKQKGKEARPRGGRH